MYSRITTAVIKGLESIPIYVEADACDGLPMFEMVGFLASEVREAKERVRTALRNSGFYIQPKKITVNLTPADIRKSGNGYDLPVAASILAAFGYISTSVLDRFIIIGEIGLSGDILPVKSVLPIASSLSAQGFEGIILPAQNASEAGLCQDIKVIPLKTLKEFAKLCQDGLQARKFYVHKEAIHSAEYQEDFSDIHGQPLLKRACEIAVSGMHNLLMVGSPGAGKTMIAKRLPTILPPLEAEEMLEVSKIYSICGFFGKESALKYERPFRNPHHTITPQALAGGGREPKPGEISLSHKGVLFLDELPEFKKGTLEVLREPLEEKTVRISRSEGIYEFPADFMLVAAMNACKCGYYPDLAKCRCSPSDIRSYVRKLSHPLLDRIDICVEAEEITFDNLNNSGKNENSAEVRERVVKMHALQRERYRNRPYSFNSQIPANEIKEFCQLRGIQENKIRQKYEEYNLTARTYYKTLRIARTVADMEGSAEIAWRHFREALLFRGFDRKYWGMSDEI